MREGSVGPGHGLVSGTFPCLHAIERFGYVDDEKIGCGIGCRTRECDGVACRVSLLRDSVLVSGLVLAVFGTVLTMLVMVG